MQDCAIKCNQSFNFIDYRAGGGGPKSVADPPSKATVVNSETAVRIQTKSFRPKLKLTFKDQTNSINNKVSISSTFY